MTPAVVLDKLLPRWRAKLPPRFSPEFIDGFIARNRSALEAVVARIMMLRGVKRGASPQTPEAFAVYGRLAQRERPKDGDDDRAVLHRVRARVEKMKPRGRVEPQAAAMVYVQARAEAVLLRQAGWDAVPLLLREPALALLLDAAVIGVVDVLGELHVAPDFGHAEQLQRDVTATRDRVEALTREIAEQRLERFALALWSRVRGATPTPVTAPVDAPDLQTKAWRTEANLRAMRLALAKEPGELTAEDHQTLAQYSGWGGLSIEAVKKMMPAELVPESFGLIHEYYTPTVIAEAIAETLCPLLPELAGNDGVVRALEPSAGIGRLIRAFSPRRCLALEAGGQIKKIEWTVVEFSKVSSTLLRALRPDVDLHHMPFERWVREEGPRFHGTLGLVVSNPPYGERGVMAREDPDEFYKEKRAYAYFMRRTLDLLVPGGVGVFLVPSGFLTGTLSRPLREKLLRRHHLLGAFRIPSHDSKGRDTVPGASVVMDVLFWRSRGGELAEVDPADQDILEGDYFKTHPGHLLGKEEGAFSGDDEAGTARTWRYTVSGDFTGLPALVPRPLCTSCTLTSIAPSTAGTFQSVTRVEDEVPGDVAEDVRPALELGRRVGRYLAAVGADDAVTSAQMWPELHTALEDFVASFGNPWTSKPLRALADGRKLAAAQQILAAFEKTGEIAAVLREPPKVTPKFTGQPDDVVAQAEALFRQQRALTFAQLMDFHRKQGGTLDPSAALEALFSAAWNLDGDGWDELYPVDAYTTGNDLWARYDRATVRAHDGDEQARVQARRLLEAIKPAVFDDLTDLSPQHGYVPLELAGEWLSATINSRYGAVALERKGGFVQVLGHDYTADEPPPIAPETLAFLGFYNHDPELFRPPQERSRDEERMTREERAAKKQSLAERRIAQAKKWDESFRAWVAADDGRREQLVHAYNRVARGRIVPTFPPEPLDIARWGPNSPQLKAHQIAAARRVLANRGGGVFLDVGVGKTYTALAIIARARQEGWVRRPVILVPGSLVWKWHDDILCTLPDYRVAVIGSKRKKLSRGARKGLVTSETDTPDERARKWTLLQTGQVDVVVLSYDALARTKMNEDAVMAYVEQVEAVARSIALRKRTLEEKNQSAKQRAKLSEREQALLEHGVRAWVEEILALPSDWQYDPGVAWDDIGVDMLVVDEAAAFKNLYKPQPREDGVPRFMGGGGDGSDRAWQLDFRAAAVRRKTGGAGIVLLTATPAKNSPLEFYNLIQFIDPTAFTRAGIRDPEQFIDRFLKIEQREVLDSTFEVTKKSAVTGFKNLDDLRTIIFTYGEFRTAAEVGLKLPRPVVETLTIAMDDEQESKYASYVAQIEQILENPNPEGGESNAILGLLARLSLVALHGALEEGYTFKTALDGGVVKRRVYEDGEPVDVNIRLSRPTYESPKLTECAKRVAASPHCGHIIFCEPTAVHQWMREVLVKHGIPRERIAILNAEATAPADRIRIAREFNGLSSEPPAPGTCARPTDSTVPPKYDVVIANSVAYEGVDLQVRTCTIHHLDLPWTPADLEQRNGRAVRQGNTLGTVQIFYYFADGSTDGYRFSLIDGKAAWLGELIKSQVRDTNNPAAQQQLTPEDILLMISRNKEKTRALLQEKKKRQAEEARARIAREAARIFRQAAGRFREARATTDPERAARLREEGEQRLADLEQVNADAWPWAPWMYAVRDTDVLVPENGAAPVYEGLRLARPHYGAPDQLDYVEFGQIVSTDEGEKIALRAAGSPSWNLIAYNGDLGGVPIAVSEMPRDGGPLWPDDDDARTAQRIDQKLDDVFRFESFEMMRWRGASDAWLEKWWPRFADRITEGLAGSSEGEKVPVVDDEGLVIVTGSEIEGTTIVPPTRAGWLRFLELAPRSGESYTTLKEVGLDWWGRKIPQNLLSSAREEAEEATPGPAAQADAGPAEAAAVDTDSAGEPNAEDAARPYDDAREAAVRAEEEWMGERLRAARDEEEAAWAEAVRRGTEIEVTGGLDSVTARKTAIEKLARDIKHYEQEHRPYDEARSAIKALGLPPKKYAYYLRQAEEAIVSGKSYLPIVARARKAAGKSAADASASGEQHRPTPAPAQPAPRSAIDAAVETFNAEARWRVAVHRRLPNGYVLVVFPEGRDQDEAVASLDVRGYDVDDVRWLDERVSAGDQDAILERLERALWAAADADADDNETRSSSPIQDLIDLMERRSKALGAEPTASKIGARTDGFGQIARALQDLATPATLTADDLEHWLESENLTEAAEAVGRLRVSDPAPVRRVMREVWDKVLEELPVMEVQGRRGDLHVDESAIFRVSGASVLLQRVQEGERVSLRRIRVREDEIDDGIVGIEDPTDRLTPGALVHQAERNEDFFVELYDKLGSFHDDLVRAPRTLQDVRLLLFWTAVMLDAPLCQGDVKRRATAAFEQAKGYYDRARERLIEGQSVDAVRRMQAALRRIGAAAAEIARSCGEGQLVIGVTPPHLPVQPEDRAEIEGSGVEVRP